MPGIGLLYEPGIIRMTEDEAIAFARTLIRDALATPRSPGLQQ